MIRFALICSLLMLAGSNPAAADDDPHAYVDRSGPYIGFASALGGLVEIDDEIEDVIGSNVDTDLSLGLQARVGYRIHSLFGAEVTYEWLAEADVETGSFGTLAEIEIWTLTADAKLFLPNWKNGQFFLHAGAGVLGATLKDTSGFANTEDDVGFAARFGAGVDVYLTEHITMTAGASYVMPTGSVKHLDYVSGNAGLQYRF